MAICRENKSSIFIQKLSIPQHLQQFSVLNPNAKTFKPILSQNIKSYKITEKSYAARADACGYSDVCCHSNLNLGKFKINQNINNLDPNAKIFQPKTSIYVLNPCVPQDRIRVQTMDYDIFECSHLKSNANIIFFNQTCMHRPRAQLSSLLNPAAKIFFPRGLFNSVLEEVEPCRNQIRQNLTEGISVLNIQAKVFNPRLKLSKPCVEQERAYNPPNVNTLQHASVLQPNGITMRHHNNELTPLAKPFIPSALIYI